MASVKRWLVGEPVSAARVAQIRAQLAAQTGAPSRRAAMTGGAALMGSSMAGMGGQSPAPMNAPPAGQLVPGVQPGTSNAIINAIILIIQALIPGSGAFVYSAAAGLGDLIASITAADGKDPFGNTTYASICAYQANGTANPSAVAQLAAGQLNIGAGFQFQGLGGASPAALGGAAAQGSGSSIELSSGEDSSGDAPAALTVRSADATGGSSTVGTVATTVPILLGDTAPPPASNKATAIYADVNSIPRALNANDGEIYALGHIVSSIGPFTINSTVDHTLASTTVGAGTYKIKAMYRCVAAASGTAQALRVGFTGTPAVTGTRTFVKSYFEASNETMSAGNISGLSSYYDTGSVPNGTVFDIDIEGVWVFSAGGTFNFVAHVATSGSDESFTIQQFSFISVEPG